MHVDLHLLVVQLICDGQCTNWFTLQFYKDIFYSIHVMGNLPNIVRQCEQLFSSPQDSAGPIFSHSSSLLSLETANFTSFTTFPIFSHQSGSESLRMANFTWITTFPAFPTETVHKSLRMANFAKFTTFPIFSHWSSSESLGMANFAWFATFQSFPTKVAQNNSKWPISLNSQLFQSFPTEATQNDLEWTILPNSHQSGSEWLSSPDSQLLQSFPTKAAQNGQFSPFYNFSKLFPMELLRITQNDQFCLFHNFSNLFLPKQLRMNQNSQNWWKLIYLSRFLTNLHQTFRIGLVSLSQFKWVQGVLCYDQNWQKLKHLSGNWI